MSIPNSTAITGWDKAFDNVTADIKVTAQYEEVTTVYYTVTYFDWDLTLLGTEKVEEGHDAKGWEPEPEREGYTFIGWSKPLTNITADVNVAAEYKKNDATAIGEMETDTDAQTAQPATRILRNGTLYILRNGILYTPYGYRIN